jgi:hypothetical protein
LAVDEIVSLARELGFPAGSATAEQSEVHDHAAAAAHERS